MDRLTVLVPTRNRPDYLRCCLESILDAFGPGQFVVVGDNGDHEVTEPVIAELPDLRITHIKNPPGGTYIKNIQSLIDHCQSEWLSILHDDDYFSPGASQVIEPFIADPAVDFIFADHWVCDHDGIIDEHGSEENSRHYGRDTLLEGPQSDLGLLAVNRSICLDGFYVRTSLARSFRLDVSSPIYSDSRWLIEVCDHARLGVYLPQRLHTYRASLVSLTNSTPPLSAHLDQWRSLQRIVVKNTQTRRRLRMRRLQCLLDILKTLARNFTTRSRLARTP